jgi:peroxiredoxin (alkyl hydroperoxide reductase subunit C)
MGADLVTVSVDSIEVHLAWQRHEVGLKNVKYSMGSDQSGAVSQMFGVYDDEAGKCLRGSFIISPEGKLLSSEMNYGDVGRNIDELMRKFKAYLHVSKHPVKACPSKWKDEGDATLEPGAKLVGKVFKEDGTY